MEDPADIDDARRVALFVTCVGDVVEPDVPAAAVAVLRAVGCDVAVPDGQTCCGQPAWNAGFAAEAATVARTSLDALHGALHDADVVVVPAGSCATMIRLYWPQLFELADDPEAAERARSVAARTREVTELLHALPDGRWPTLGRVPERTVAYHRSCHLLRELHITEAPEALLDRVPGCERVEWEAADRCCGFGGTFSVKLPEASVAMADDKLDVLPAAVGTIAGADASCLLQLRSRADERGLGLGTCHVVEVLAESIGAGAEAPAGEQP